MADISAIGSQKVKLLYCRYHVLATCIMITSFPTFFYRGMLRKVSSISCRTLHTVPWTLFAVSNAKM